MEIQIFACLIFITTSAQWNILVWKHIQTYGIRASWQVIKTFQGNEQICRNDNG